MATHFGMGHINCGIATSVFFFLLTEESTGLVATFMLLRKQLLDMYLLDTIDECCLSSTAEVEGGRILTEDTLGSCMSCVLTDLLSQVSKTTA